MITPSKEDVKKVEMINREGKAVMIYVSGSKRAFSCEQCAANVFTQFPKEPNKFYCNGCPAIYKGRR